MMMLAAGLIMIAVAGWIFAGDNPWFWAKEGCIFLFVGAANLFGAWRFWRTSPRTNRWVSAGLAIIPVLTVYFASYAFLGHRVCGVQPIENGASYCGPAFHYHWQSRLFIPAAAIESFVFQRNVVIGSVDELTWYSPAWQKNATEGAQNVGGKDSEYDR
jgi:hypothetical protein